MNGAQASVCQEGPVHAADPAWEGVPFGFWWREEAQSLQNETGSPGRMLLSVNPVEQEPRRRFIWTASAHFRPPFCFLVPLMKWAL